MQAADLLEAKYCKGQEIYQVLSGLKLVWIIVVLIPVTNVVSEKEHWTALKE